VKLLGERQFRQRYNGARAVIDSKDLRVREHPYLKFERGKKIAMRFDGQQVEAYENETIGVALHASGARIFGRSLKYHRPRGLLCVSGRCSNCMLRVNGVPNVRVCVEPVREGAVIESQNAFPNVTHDAYSLLDRLDFMMPVGFQYRRFIRPKFVSQIFENVVRKMAGRGSIPDEDAILSSTYPALELDRSVDVAVVGGGPAGISAAISAARAGAKVALFDENSHLGGRLLKQTCRYDDAGPYTGLRGFEIANRMVEETKFLPALTPHLGTLAAACYEGRILTVFRENSLQELNPKTLILAPGAYERTMVFENNDLPGILLADGARTLMNFYGVRPGNRAVVASNDGSGQALALELLDAGMYVEAIIESRACPEEAVRESTKSGTKLLSPYVVKSAHGNSKLNAITAVQTDGKGEEIPGTEMHLQCDTLCVSCGTNPAFELVSLAGAKMEYDPRADAFLPARTKGLEVASRVFVVGDVCRTRDLGETILEGCIAGNSAALLLGYGDGELKQATDKMLARRWEN